MELRQTLIAWFVFSGIIAAPRPILGQQDTTVAARGDSVSVRLIDVDLQAAIQALAPYLDRPIVYSGIAGRRVSLETQQPVHQAAVAGLVRALLESQGLELIEEPTLYRIRVPDRSAPRPARAAQAEVPELFVVRLRHARAADVAATVNALYGQAAALGEIGSQPGTLADALRQQQVPPVAPPSPNTVTAVAGRSARLAGDVTIVPDQPTNSLLIRASREDFELIKAAIDEVDARPLQVLIEVLIAEVRRDRGLSFGVDLDLPRIPVPGSSNTTVEGSQQGIGVGDFAIRVMGIGGVDLDATLRAAASRGDVTIVSRPIVIAANNQVAQILVGSQRPFVQVQRSLPTDAPIRDQVIQYRNVGTHLTVRPTISSENYVMLEVTQEVNAATNETAFDAPVISTRSVQTQLLVRDSQTVVLGGLADTQRDVNQGGVPVLSSIPFLGALFGRASRRTTEVELFLFLTPRIIASDSDADQLTRPLHKRAEDMEK